MRDREQQKKPNLAGLVLLLLVMAPHLVIPMAIFAGIVYLAIRLVKNQQNSQPAKSTQAKKQSAMDDCPKKLFCFHKDKGEHHLARGREIDPWDRPDIDIRKYQRKE